MGPVLPGDYEPAKQSFLRDHCRPGSTVLDLGAHLGLYTVLMARYVGPGGRVLAFEPTPATRRELHRTVHLNGVTNVEIRDEAVSWSTGEALLNDTGDPVSNANSLAPVERTRSRVAVCTRALDDLAIPGPVSCIKIDIEGAEVDALRGASALLARERPALTIEIHPVQLGLVGAEAVEIWDLLQAMGYVMREGPRQLSRDEVDSRCDDCYETQAIPVR
ncbi:MAG: FkbM family methyltransferase [Acidimicrobiales bacterium]